MKAKLTFLLSILSLFMLFCACEDNDDNKSKDKGEETDNEYVNNWILDSMSMYYLWNDKLPKESDLNLNADPYDFFDSLLGYEASLYDGYPFSRMEGTHISLPKSAVADNATTSSDLGFEFTAAWYENPRVAITIIYVKKGTQAEAMGLKRGQAIIKVDDKNLYDKDETALGGLYWVDALKRGKSNYKIDIYDPATKEIKTDQILYTTPNYQENPIYLDSIYTINNRSIGYIMYNSYEAGGEAALPYDVELAQIFTRFEREGVKDLIFDLRYNGGGYTRSAKFIVSALVPITRSAKDIFEVKTYNPSLQAQLDKLPDTNLAKISWMYEYLTDNIENSNGQKLSPIATLGKQLDNICFIGTGYTASASEMTINTLNPYYKEAGKNIYLVGENTVGKDVGSWAIYEDNNERNTYVLWPITFKSHNKLYPREESSNYSEGFKPDVEADEFKTLASGLKGLGNKDETLLSAAIAKLTGGETKSYTKSDAEDMVIRGKSSLNAKKNRNQMYTDRKDIKSLNIK